MAMPNKEHVILSRRPVTARGPPMIHRWPKSLHSQTEAIFHSVRSIRAAKTDTTLGIRSFGSWKVYKYEAHRFAKFMIRRGLANIFDTQAVRDNMAEYLVDRLKQYVEQRRSRQSFVTILSALGKFEYAMNHYIEMHVPSCPRLETENLRREFYARSRKQLCLSSKIFNNRAYPDPIRLISAIPDGTFQLQESLQYEGGLRTEGVGAPSNRRLKNPLKEDGLRGITTDPVTGLPVGVVASVEKGGKETEHYISVETYGRLEQQIKTHGKLESDYSEYLEAINQAARRTGQYAPGRGSHALKHNFAQERYLECIKHGMTHEQALQQTSLETSHFRLRETLTYTRG